jgi:hypothetical protein
MRGTRSTPLPALDASTPRCLDLKMTDQPVSQQPPAEDYGAPSPRSTGRIAVVVFLLLTLLFLSLVTWALSGMRVPPPRTAPEVMQSATPSST